MALVAARFAEVRKGLEEELKGGQALLSINYRSRLNVTGWLAHVVQYDGAHEVGPHLSSFKQPLSQGSYVEPERLPLLVLSPHIGPLKEGYYQPAILFEDDLCAPGTASTNASCLIVGTRMGRTSFGENWSLSFRSQDSYKLRENCEVGRRRLWNHDRLVAWVRRGKHNP